MRTAGSAPSAVLVAISFVRAVARASSRLATFVHATSKHGADTAQEHKQREPKIANRLLVESCNGNWAFTREYTGAPHLFVVLWILLLDPARDDLRFSRRLFQRGVRPDMCDQAQMMHPYIGGAGLNGQWYPQIHIFAGELKTQALRRRQCGSSPGE